METNNNDKATIGSLMVRLLITCAVLAAAQYVVPYYLLAGGAAAAGIFMTSTSKDPREGWVMLAAGVFIAVFGWVSVHYWQGVAS